MEPTVRRIENAGIELALAAGIDLASSEQEILNARRFSVLKACVGIHPWNADLFSKEALRKLKDLSANEEVVAFSEIGLDYVSRRDRETLQRVNEPIDKQIQRNAFREQLRAAKDLNLPVIVHDRTHGQEVLDILEVEGNAKLGAAIHGFNKDIAYAKRCVEMGIYISVGLIPRSIRDVAELGRSIRVIPESGDESIKEAIRQTDLKWILTETDRNDSEQVLTSADRIAELKHLKREDVGLAATRNLRKLIKL